jgi:ribosomal protein S17E
MVDELTEGATTRVRNQVAGYITRTYTLKQQRLPPEEEEILEEI